MKAYRAKQKKRKARKEFSDREIQRTYDELAVRHLWLSVLEKEHEMRLRKQAIKLSQKYMKEQPGVI